MEKQLLVPPSLLYALVLIHKFLAKTYTIVLPQSPYSPDLAQTDFFLYSKLKTTLKRKYCQIFQDMRENFAEGSTRDSENT